MWRCGAAGKKLLCGAVFITHLLKFAVLRTSENSYITANAACLGSLALSRAYCSALSLLRVVFAYSRITMAAEAARKNPTTCNNLEYTTHILYTYILPLCFHFPCLGTSNLMDISASSPSSSTTETVIDVTDTIVTSDTIPATAAVQEIPFRTRIGQSFTSAGPAPYAGDILDNPDLVWTQDEEWDDARQTEAFRRLSLQGASTVSNFWKNKYETKGGKYWHEFYKRNTNKFYKDRHYLHLEFPEILQCDVPILRLLEVGCGVGNAILPLLELNPVLDIHAIDFAQSAIDMLNSNDLLLANSVRMRATMCDIINDQLPVIDESLDLVLCMFVLSAVPPHNQLHVLRKLAASLKVGGKLLLRDYGRYDEAQLRFKRGSKLDDNFYVRQDGTTTFFFELQEFNALCEQCGLIPEDAQLLRRQYANREQKAARNRVFINGKYIKQQQQHSIR